MSNVNPLVARDEGRWREDHPAWWRRLLAAYDRVAVRLVERNPEAAVRALGQLGATLHALGLVAPRASQVHAVFPALDQPGVRRVARRSASLRFKNRAAIALLHARGPAALARLLASGHDAAPASLVSTRGAIILAFHIGAEFGITAALHHWKIDPVPLRNWSIDDIDDRARALRQAVDEVRRGRPVLAIVDGPGGASSAPLTVLGRRIVFRRAPFMLARVTRAPLVPVVAQWTPEGCIRVTVDEPLEVDRTRPAEQVEARMAAAAGAWVEHHLVTQPEDAWPYTIANFAGVPRAAVWES